MSADSDPSRGDGRTAAGSGAALSELEQARRSLYAQRRVLELMAVGRPIDEALSALLETIEDECPGTRASILLLDEDGHHLRHCLAPNLPDAYNRAVDGLRIGPKAGSCGTAAYRGERVVVENIETDPLWADYKELALAHGLRACWSQPILSMGRKVLGTLAMYYPQARGPGAADCSYIELAAQLAGIAMDRDRNERARRAREQRVLNQASVLVALARSEALGKADFRAFSREATETAAGTMGVERVGIWLFNDDRRKLRCVELYEMSVDQHTDGIELEADQYPRYFAALERGRSVPAHDARRHADTSEFAESYLTPLGISSMLDAPVRKAGELVGVVCHEHVGPAREWTFEEQEFAASVADFVALALEASERRRAEQNYRVAQEELLRQQWHARRQVESELEGVKDELVLKARMAAIGQVAAIIAHELRQPLTSIRNARYYLTQRVIGSDEKCLTHLDIIEQELNAADGIVADLLEMSRAKEPERQSLNLEEAVRGAFGRISRTDEVRLDLSLVPDPFAIDADPDQLRQLLVNLFTNSTQALEGKGRIRVEALTGEDGARQVTISDDGPGIPAAASQRVFEPLYTTKLKGTGLGLTICRQIAERHGWTIELADSPDGGAAFRIEMK